jgi:hypothetical protein
LVVGFTVVFPAAATAALDEAAARSSRSLTTVVQQLLESMSFSNANDLSSV